MAAARKDNTFSTFSSVIRNIWLANSVIPISFLNINCFLFPSCELSTILLKSTITDDIDSRKINLKLDHGLFLYFESHLEFCWLIPCSREVEMVPYVDTRVVPIPSKLLAPWDNIGGDDLRSEKTYPRTTFSSLPPELRFQIWENTFPEPRWLHRLPLPPPPIALSICQESRLVALQNFSPVSNNPYCYINWSTDI